jgi:hypothetical protein
MKKWMIFMRESDGIHFLWNGEHPIRISPISAGNDRWHHSHGELPTEEIYLLNDTMNSRARGFTIYQRGRYQIVARGEFKEL